MAAPMTRVARGDSQRQHVDFQLPPEKALGYDEAMVGGADEQASTIEIDPSERDNNPYLGGGEDEPDTWDLPEGQTQQPTQPRQQEREAPPQDQGEPESDEDVRLAYDEDEPLQRQERVGRRARRNRNTRQAIDQRDQIIAGLNDRVTKQEEMLARVMGGQFQLSARDIDQRIQFNSAALERANVEMARAIKEADGEAFAAIQTERDKIYRELYGLQQYRQNLEQAAERTFGRGGPTGQTEERPPQQQGLTPEQLRAQQDNDAEFERMRDIFLDRYTWFDPEGGNDEDHEFVFNLDQKLTREGYNRGTQAFWHQMERRMQAAGFRPDGGQQRQQQEEERDMQPPRRVNGNGHDQGNGTRRFNGPPTGVVRSGRRGGTNGGYQLSEMEQDMLRDEGLLEPNLNEADLAKRDRIINKWQRGKQAMQRGGRR